MSAVPGEVIPLGARLRQRREELGLTQAQAARELEVARTAYRLWELEAARPAPDRWRAIARWLGITMTALLLAGEFVDEAEALDGERAADAAGLSGRAWDERSGAADGDFFVQEAGLIADVAATGSITASQAARLQAMLDRVRHAASDARQPSWQAAGFRKRLASTELAPALARAALLATAAGLPVAVLDDAMLLMSELVSNSVRHSGSDWVGVEITVGRTLRIAVSDGSTRSIRPVTASRHGGWGMVLLAELADGWGVERTKQGKTVWVELDPTSDR